MESILMPQDDGTRQMPAIDSGTSPIMNRARFVFDTSDQALDVLVARQLTIGRGSHQQALLDLSALNARQQGVSRRHARIDYRGGRWYITDLESQNGTRLNGLELFPLVATEIRSGSRLHFGSLGCYVYFG